MKNNITKYCLSFLLLFLSIGTFAQLTAEQHKKLTNDLQQKLDKLQQKYQFVGATFGVVLPNNQTIALATGLKDKAKNQALSPKDKMLAGSIGKTYCMAIVLQLAEEGKIGLEDKISKYFSSETWFNKLPNAEEITVKMLLNHTGGLPRWVFEQSFWNTLKEQPNKTWTGVERLEYVFGRKPEHPAGKGWAYSDTDYILLGMIVEKVTGTEFYKLYKKRLCKPFKLKNTVPSNKRKIKRLANGYSGKNPYKIPNAVLENKVYFTNPQFEWTGGGFATTALDLAKWVKILHSGNVVSKKYRDLLQQPVNQETGQPDKLGYGFANQVKTGFEGTLHGHSGFMPGYLSMMQYVPKYDYSIAFQINSDVFNEALKMKSLDYYLERLRSIVTSYLEEETNDGLTTIYLIRHAEKAKNDPKDPDLSEAGQARAKKLAKLLSNVQFDAVYSTNFKRTQQTVKPLVTEQKLEVLPYDHKDPKGTFKTIFEKYSGGNILIAGHSNTTPTFVNTLLNKAEYDWLDESEFDKIFVVTIDKNGVAKVNVLSF